MVNPTLIRSNQISAAISPLGAELQALRDAAGRDLLHDGASFWSSRAPLLFPIVGALKDNQHSVDGVAYELPKHGFARRSVFEQVEAAPDRATFRLADSEATRASYPYRFRLDVAFAVEGATLTTTARVENTDECPIPVAFGFHPAFRWPLSAAHSKGNYVIEFEAEEPGPLTRIGADGLIARELSTPVEGRRLVLADTLFDEDALIFLAPRSRSLRFGPADGGSPSLSIGFPSMPHLGIWTKPGGAPFLCIEPWSGHASPADYAGPLIGKPGSRTLAPGEIAAYEMSVELR
jgi:galactose mutarotase-like enzyme